MLDCKNFTYDVVTQVETGHAASGPVPKGKRITHVQACHLYLLVPAGPRARAPIKSRQANGHGLRYVGYCAVEPKHALPTSVSEGAAKRKRDNEVADGDEPKVLPPASAKRVKTSD